ncbi:hypothetical protein ACQW02_25500 [Humitalea sp. 24SJ18S-53]|uniref:hypothetical protein n=1 Tax=Humitalea sp. 24SJ18S-53 TaxID=3422307 RepID=UPI003D669F9D
MSKEIDHDDAVKAIVAEWGEPFASLATDERIAFEDGKIWITLWKQLMIDGEQQGRIGFTEPTLDQLQKLDAIPGEIGKTRRLLVQVCGLTEKEAGAIGLRDLTKAGQVLAAFTDTARATGV